MYVVKYTTHTHACTGAGAVKFRDQPSPAMDWLRTLPRTGLV